MIKNPLISVIVPVYNVMNYLEETVLSIINQTIDFKTNIELILVNDGSKDDSEIICANYLGLFPENIKYLKQDNAGVSSARNIGFLYARGKYILFLDSDDKWESDGLNKIITFLETNDNVDFACGRLKYFDLEDGFYHPMDSKFSKGSRLIDVRCEPDALILHVSSCVFKREALASIKFEEQLRFSEDTLFVTEVLLKKGIYGVVPDAIFYYRKRNDLTSAINNSRNSKDWYFSCFKFFYDKVFAVSKTVAVDCNLYIRNLVMYDLQWRFNSVIPENLLSQDEYFKYFCELKRVLQLIDISVIVSQKQINFRNKMDVLKLRNGNEFTKSLIIQDNSLLYNGDVVFNADKDDYVSLLDIKHKEGCLFLSGIEYNVFSDDSSSVFVIDQFGKKYPFIKHVDYCKYPHVSFDSSDKKYDKYFEIMLPLSFEKSNVIPEYRFCLDFNGIVFNLTPGRFSLFKINSSGFTSFLKVKENLVVIEKSIIKVFTRSSNAKKVFGSIERRYEIFLINKGYKKIAYTRKVVLFLKKFLKKQIWLVSDRTYQAGDNGEVFFNYLIKHPSSSVKTYFVISKNTKDYKRLKKIGNVVDFGSNKYKLLFLLSSKIISSQAENYVCNAFGWRRKFYSDLYDFDFVFLQHGIIKDDLSDWLHKINKNIDLFVTSTIDEYDSIVKGNYYYDESNVVMTGIPRLDNLIISNKKEKKQIVFMPTWRKNLASQINDKTGKRSYVEGFKRSDYYNFYNSLINDSRLLSAMKKHAYSGLFVLHPCFSEQLEDFNGNDVIKFTNSVGDLQKIIIESKLLLTDYSSVAFDFAYANKPVVYTQFDVATFFDGAVYTKGYYNYEENGFGPVMYDLDSTINELIYYMESDCNLLDKYKYRRDKCFSTNMRGDCCKKLLCVLSS